jgi:hypothetical protein
MDFVFGNESWRILQLLKNIARIKWASVKSAKESLIPLRFPANYVGGIVPLALRTSFHFFSARVTIASGIIRLTLQTYSDL